MAFELYNTLELDKNASLDDINRAKFKMMKKHPPEKDPKGYQLAMDAHRVLSDAKSRKDYDDDQTMGPEIETLMSKGDEQMEEEKFSAAIKTYKNVLVLKQDMIDARNMLGLAYLNNADYGNAKKQFVKITKNIPNNAIYWSNYAHTLFREVKESPNLSESLETSLLSKSEEYFEKAICIEPKNSNPYLTIAEIYSYKGNFNQALIWTDKAIDADDEVDYHDLEALVYQAIVYYRMNKTEYVEYIADRISPLVPKEKEAREYVAYKFCALGDEIKAGCKFYEASLFYKAGLKFDENSKDLKKTIKLFTEIYQALDELEDLINNDEILYEFKEIARVISQQNLGFTNLDIKDDQVDSYVNEMVEHLKDIYTSDISKSISIIKTSYKGIYSWVPFFENLFKNFQKDEVDIPYTMKTPKEVICPQITIRQKNSKEAKLVIGKKIIKDKENQKKKR